MSLKERLVLLSEKVQEHALHPVTLICVSKNVEVSKMKEAYEAGLRHFGESRVQEALSKKDRMPQEVIWHFIGPIQSNKAKVIAENFHFVHSVASFKVAKILSDTGLVKGTKIKCFIEINTSKEPSKQGFLEDELEEVMPRLQELKGLDIQGFMTIGPHTQNEERIRKCFQILLYLKEKFKYPFLSMGMSEDYLLALEEGATHIRIGSFLFS